MPYMYLYMYIYTYIQFASTNGFPLQVGEQRLLLDISGPSRAQSISLSQPCPQSPKHLLKGENGWYCIDASVRRARKLFFVSYLVILAFNAFLFQPSLFFFDNYFSKVSL